MYGFIEVKCYDFVMLRMSEFLFKFEQYMIMFDGMVFFLYGDFVYFLCVYFIMLFKGVIFSDQERIFNGRMLKFWLSVEWIFGKIFFLFVFVDYKKN